MFFENQSSGTTVKDLTTATNTLPKKFRIIGNESVDEPVKCIEIIGSLSKVNGYDEAGMHLAHFDK